LELLALTWRDLWATWWAPWSPAPPAARTAAAVSGASSPAVRIEGPVADDPWVRVVSGGPPPVLVPPASPALEGEGEWRAFSPSLVREGPSGPVLFATFFRPDPSRALTSQVTVVSWDPAVVDVGFAPGTLDPPAADGTIPAGRVPRDPERLERLLAAFSGGFQAVNGQFGQIIDRREFVPVQPWAATIVRFDDGAIGFGTWPGELFDLPPGIASVRQNLSPLLEDGVFNPYRRTSWGGLAPTVRSEGRDADVVPTVRSAICLTEEGFAAHVWGAFLTVRTLAAAARAARCRYAVALDINPGNVLFELYRVGTPEAIERLGPPGEGEATGDLGETGLRYRAHLLVPSMADDPGRFLVASERDLIYLVLREAPLPEAPPPADVWRDGVGARPVFAADRGAVRRMFPDVRAVLPSVWVPAQRDTLSRGYVQRIRRIWERKAGRGLRPQVPPRAEPE
jgi:hypothetical protein